MATQQDTIRFKLPQCFMWDAEPMLDDATNPDTEDPYLIRAKALVEAIAAGKPIANGVHRIYATVEVLEVIVEEASYRGEAARDMAMSDPWERMALLSKARSHEATAKKAQAGIKALGGQA